MFAGMPTHYHISCRVRNSDYGIDTKPSEQADHVIQADGRTAFAVLCVWLLDPDSWLTATPEAIRSLLELLEGDLEAVEMVGPDPDSDWETGDIQIDEKAHTLHMNGTACLSEFEFEIVIKPCDSSGISTQEYTDARYLLALSEKIMNIPTTYGTDQSDHDELRAIAARLDQQAVTDDLNDSD